ncbi:MAG: EutN/CcmL family microcompartment protein [Peptococcaceae bacterium]|nr:EutN/CcmL family microcompartment protein [Peptococcaceae bacterium]
MQIAKVIGNIWATRKETSLTGLKLLIVQPINILDNDKPIGEPVVAADIIGAGTGETVIIAVGSTARVAAGSMDTAVDATVVGKEVLEKTFRLRRYTAEEGRIFFAP